MSNSSSMITPINYYQYGERRYITCVMHFTYMCRDVSTITVELSHRKIIDNITL